MRIERSGPNRSYRRQAWAAVLLALAAGCAGEGETTPGWTDAEDYSSTAVRDPAIVVEGAAWQLQVGDDPGDGDPRPCLQMLFAGVPVGCIRVGAESGSWYGFDAWARVGVERLVWRGESVQDTPADRYVVWSSASPSGRIIEPIVYDDVENLVWLMEPGEEPWGYQTIAADGSLREYRSLVGLPGE